MPPLSKATPPRTSWQCSAGRNHSSSRQAVVNHRSRQVVVNHRSRQVVGDAGTEWPIFCKPTRQHVTCHNHRSKKLSLSCPLEREKTVCKFAESGVEWQPPKQTSRLLQLLDLGLLTTTTCLREASVWHQSIFCHCQSRSNSNHKFVHGVHETSGQKIPLISRPGCCVVGPYVAEPVYWSYPAPPGTDPLPLLLSGPTCLCVHTLLPACTIVHTTNTPRTQPSLNTDQY